MQYIINDHKTLSTIAIGGWVYSGCCHDREGKFGEHHVLEHIMFNDAGVKQRVDALKRKGLTVNGFTSHELMCFYVNCTVNTYKESLEYIEYIMSGNMDLTGNIGLEIEKQIIIREIEYHYNYIEELKKNLLTQMFYKYNHINFSIMGSKESVIDIKQNDIVTLYEKIRTDKKNFITIAGNINDLDNNENNIITSPSVYNKPIEPFSWVKLCPGDNYYVEEINESGEYCYYGITIFIDKKYRFYGVIYTDYLRDQLFDELREKRGFTYRINYSNMNLQNGLIGFFIFKLRRNEVDVAQHIIDEVMTSNINEVCFKEYILKNSVKKSIKNDNVISKMLELGYQQTILSEEYNKENIIEIQEFFEYVNHERRKYYQRVVSVGN